MPTYSTPGSYIEEISKLPASVAPVATAIPAFVGYTEKNDGNNIPTRITSMLEYVEKFGGAFNEKFKVTLNDSAPEILVESVTSLSSFLLYYQLEMYFANGGGPCYIVSVDIYTSGNVGKAKLKEGLEACKKEDEITLLCIPEAITLTVATDRTELNDVMLTQCALLKDRFAIIDVFTGDSTVSIFDDGGNFRNEVGTGNLKYGGAYYPALNTSIEYGYNGDQVDIQDFRKLGIYHGLKLSSILSTTGKTAEYILDFQELVLVRPLR